MRACRSCIQEFRLFMHFLRHIKISKTPLGRPIVSGVGSMTERASKLVDECLRPHVTTLPSYIKYTADLLKNLDGLNVPAGCLLVAIDIKALYSSIPHNQGIETVSRFLGERGPKFSGMNQFILQLLSHFLNNGHPCAPSYANLYLRGGRHLFPNEDHADLLSNIIQWHRYIDDILMLWSGWKCCNSSCKC